MKTLLINASPKKRFSASAYFAWLTGLCTPGKKVYLTLRTGSDPAPLLAQLADADAVVLVTPLYLDGLPAHGLSFLQKMEAHCRAQNLHPRVYAVANSGFIEGKQNGVLMRMVENFCARSGLAFGGGVGIGGGVMLSATRWVLLALAILLAAVGLPLGWLTGQWGLLSGLLGTLLVLAFFHAGAWWYLFRLGRAIGGGRALGVRFTRVLLPSFVFIPFANLFFAAMSLIQGGCFRRWLEPHRP